MILFYFWLTMAMHEFWKEYKKRICDYGKMFGNLCEGKRVENIL